jgi:hypothetical protein
MQMESSHFLRDHHHPIQACFGGLKFQTSFPCTCWYIGPYTILTIITSPLKIAFSLGQFCDVIKVAMIYMKI